MIKNMFIMVSNFVYPDQKDKSLQGRIGPETWNKHISWSNLCISLLDCACAQPSKGMRTVDTPCQDETHFQFVEKGPYVYREERQYVNVEFSGTRMSYQTKLKQTFDSVLTRKECGATCTETDDVRTQHFFSLAGIVTVCHRPVFPSEAAVTVRR